MWRLNGHSPITSASTDEHVSHSYNTARPQAATLIVATHERESVKGVPDGMSAVTPRLYCRDPAAEIEFCKNTFGAAELGRRTGPDGNVLHALMTIGSAMIMIESESASLTSRAPQADGSSPVVLYIYVEDVDKTVERAVTAGAKILFPVANQFWGDRMGWLMDPAGHVWTVATRIEETTAEERDERWSAIKAKSSP